MNQELPTIGSSSYVSATSNLSDFALQQNWLAPGMQQQAQGQQLNHFNVNQRELQERERAALHDQQRRVQQQSTTTTPEMIMSNKATDRRLVQVFIADPDANVPLDTCLLYSGEQKLTDLTDQELFFEIEINTILKAHNAKRVKLVNKLIKERVEHLEPARIRDLKMTVVTIASF